MYGALNDSSAVPSAGSMSSQAGALLARARRWDASMPIAASMLGTVLFLRLGEAVGALGLGYTALALVLCFIITLLTVGSMSAIASNKVIGDEDQIDGLFGAIRHSLGGRLGQLIGMMLFASCAFGAAFSLLGFAELALHFVNPAIVAAHPLPWNPSGSWVTVATSSGGLLLLTVIASFKPRISLRALCWVFIAAMATVASSSTYLSVPRVATGTGWSFEHLKQNIHANRPKLFRQMFATLVATFSGLVATTHLTGRSISALERSESRHRYESQQLVIGVHKALGVGLATHLFFTAILTVSVDAATLGSNRFIVPDTVDHVIGIIFVLLGVSISVSLSAFANVDGAAAAFGSFLSSQVPWGATAPTPSGRSHAAELQPTRSCCDWVFSWLPAIAKRFVTWAVCQSALLCGTVDQIVPLMTPTVLLTFCILNFACFFQEITSATFQPSFRMYSKWTALLGSVLSLGACFLVVSPLFVIVAALCLVSYTAVYHHELARIVDDLREAQRIRSKSYGGNDVDERILEEECTSPLGSKLYHSPVRRRNDEATETKRLQLAALFVRDAIEGRFLGKEYLIDGLNRTHYKRLYHGLHYIRMANLSVLILLAFFETPSWCFFAPSCGDPSRYLTWNLPVLPQRITASTELMCLAFLAIEMSIKYRYMGRRIYFLNKWYLVQIVFLLADCAAVLTVSFVPSDSVSSGGKASDDSFISKPLVLAPLIRPLLLLSMSHRLRTGFSSLVKALPRFIDGLLILSILIALYTVLGMVVFQGSNEEQAFFPSFGEACANLIVLLTTANFPDVMMPVYSQTRVASLFFMTFLALSQLLVMNLIFASIYQHYRNEIAERAVQFAQRRKQALEAAFHLLPTLHRAIGDHKYDAVEVKIISRRTYDRLLSELVRPTISLFRDEHKPVTERSIFYAHWVDEEEENWITYSEFVVLIMDFLAHERKTKAKRAARYRRGFRRGSVWSARNWLRTLPFHQYFEPVINLVLLGNLAAIILEIQAKISGQDAIFASWETWTLMFSAVYTIEMLLKMHAFGLAGYFDRPKNVFECLVTVVIVVAEVSVHMHNMATEWGWLRVLLLLRFLRCLRLLVALKSVSPMFATVVRLIPSFATLYGILGVVLALYAELGTQIYGGKLVVGDPRLAGIAYGQLNYFSNNFNDFASALTTLLELFFVNNWYVIMDAAVAVTSKWSRLYFISFYIIAVVMLLNLVVAFVVEAYLEITQTENEDVSHDADKSAHHNTTEAKADEVSTPTTITSSLSSEYEKRLPSRRSIAQH